MSTTPATPANRVEAAKPASGTKVLFDPDLRALLDRPPLPNETFLSLYLDASVDAQGKRHVEEFLDKRAKAARERLARLPVDLKGYDALIERVRAYADESDKSGVQGIAVFAELPPSEAGREPPFFRAFRLPVRVDNRFILASAPDLGPVLRAVGGYAHYLAVRLDADDARILSVYLGRATHGESDRAERGDEIVQGRIRSQPGGWSQMRVQRRKEEHVQRWYRDLARNVQLIAERERADGIVLLGQDVNLAAFKEELPEPVRAKVIRTDTIEPHSTDADIVARVEPLVEWAGHETRSRLVDELHDRVYRDWYAVGGIDDTLEALQQGRVERLLVSRRFDAKGKRCEKCGFLVSARHDACPYCGGRLAEVPLLQHLVERAESQEARVEFIDDPEPRLDDLEGVGALLRVFESDAIAEARQAEARGEAR